MEKINNRDNTILKWVYSYFTMLTQIGAKKNCRPGVSGGCEKSATGREMKN